MRPSAVFRFETVLSWKRIRESGTTGSLRLSTKVTSHKSIKELFYQLCATNKWHHVSQIPVSVQLARTALRYQAAEHDLLGIFKSISPFCFHNISLHHFFLEGKANMVEAGHVSDHQTEHTGTTILGLPEDIIAIPILAGGMQRT